jgi:hypothetical protein
MFDVTVSFHHRHIHRHLVSSPLTDRNLKLDLKDQIIAYTVGIERLVT